MITNMCQIILALKFTQNDVTRCEKKYFWNIESKQRKKSFLETSFNDLSFKNKSVSFWHENVAFATFENSTCIKMCRYAFNESFSSKKNFNSFSILSPQLVYWTITKTSNDVSHFALQSVLFQHNCTFSISSELFFNYETVFRHGLRK